MRVLHQPILFLILGLTSCGSAPKTLEVRLTSKPSGARVFISRRGESTYQGKVGFLKGNVKATPFQEELQLVGTTPVNYSCPITEMTTDATVLGVGGRVIKTFKEGVFRFERPGYEPVEQFVRFRGAKETISVTLPELPPGADPIPPTELQPPTAPPADASTPES